MATASALDSQIGYATEVTPGTYVAPTRTLEHVSSTLKFHRERIESSGIKAGRRGGSGRWSAGRQWVDGGVSHELSPANIGMILKNHFGAVSTTGTGPYTHSFTFGSSVETALTIQVGKPDLAGTVNAFSYLGCQVKGLKIASEVGKNAMLDLDIYGQHLDTAQTLAATAYPSAWSPFNFQHGTLSLAGSAYEFERFSFESDNGLQTGRHTHRATNPERPRVSKESAYRSVKGTISSEFISMTALNRFINGTEAALSLVFDAGASAQLRIAGNVRFDGDDVDITGPQMLQQSLPFVFLSTTSDAAMLTVTLVNGDATP